MNQQLLTSPEPLPTWLDLKTGVPHGKFAQLYLCSGFARRNMAMFRPGFTAGFKSSHVGHQEAHPPPPVMPVPETGELHPSSAQALEPTSRASLPKLCIWAVSLALDAVPKLRTDGDPPADVQGSGNKTLSILQLAVPDN
ncbi:hypothetical protein BTVI_80865 [Pitangus sulphuratus]|nr:hypothetical protein BTVI_80865 [Pitangus sulphuratus]